MNAWSIYYTCATHKEEHALRDYRWHWTPEAVTDAFNEMRHDFNKDGCGSTSGVGIVITAISESALFFW